MAITPSHEDKADKRTAKRKLGDIGENVACEYLRRHGYEILERNYLRKWGEIDIIARKGLVTHFVEVKSVSCESSALNGSHGTLRPGSGPSGSYRPEENMHPGKLKRLHRTIEIYLLHAKQVGDWQLDLVTARIDTRTHQARVELLENIVG
jgi:putative endonuclease